MTEEDLHRLIEDAVMEGRRVDYKASLPGATDADKREFLADVTSFANSSGGHLYFGIREEGGIPVELVGLDIQNLDDAIQRLENLARDGIEPRLPSLRIESVMLSSSSKPVVVLEIGRSWALPHAVSFRGHGRFYARNAAGKYPVDVTELRRLFIQSETLVDRMRNFRLDRLAVIEAGASPLAFGNWAKIVLHLIPVQAFSPGIAFDVSTLEDQATALRPLSTSGWDFRHNFDGFLTFSTKQPENAIYTYVQVFRNGCLEAADVLLLRDRDGKRYIPSVSFEENLAKALRVYLAFQRSLGVEPPIYVGLSLLGVAGYYMGVDFRYSRPVATAIDRNELVLPEIRLEAFEADTFAVLHPIFDMVWNAAGWPGSVSYRKDGSWSGD